MRAAKSKAGRPRIPFSNISNRKADGLTGSPSPAPDGEGNAQLARGGAAKKRADKKPRKWIASAIKHPGREKKRAEENGISTHAQMEKDAHSSDSSLRGAGKLGLRLSKMAKNKK